LIAVVAIIVSACGGLCMAQAQQDAVPSCGGEIVARGSVARIIDGHTFVLDDGREIRLAAIEVPLPPLAGASGGDPGGAAATDALAGLTAAAQVVLRSATVPSDRYGRIVAYGFALHGATQLPIQAAMIGAGFARVGDFVGTRECAAKLLGAESVTRQAKLGLWGDSYYDVLDADHPADVLAQRGRFALVEGKVVSVRESGATIYVNFGRRWSEDFTVTIRKRSARSFAAAGLDLKGLAGRRVMVRGVIEERGGPWIEAAHPEQIELSSASELR
jgi:endonuclease YncB( thermonuclease family)